MMLTVIIILFIVAWSPKGKQLVAFLDNYFLLFLENSTLEEKSKIELPLDKDLNCERQYFHRNVLLLRKFSINPL
jgi:hypothetical protein